MAKRKDVSPRSKRGDRSSGIVHGNITFPRDGSIPSVTGGKSPALDFTEALMSGNPEAERLVREAGVNPEEVLVVPPLTKKESLADLFIASTYDWCKNFDYTAKEEKLVAPILTAYRHAMRNSNRFVLDNDMVEYVTQVSSTTQPEKLLYRLQFATLPYETVWVEYNNRLKVRVMREIGGLAGIPDGVSDRAGLLLERVDDTMWTCTIVCEGLAGVTSPLFHGYIISIDERTHAFDRAFHGMTPFDLHYRINQKLAKDPAFADLKSDEAQQALEDVSRGAMWGYSEGKGGIITSPRELVKRIRAPEFLKRHGELAFTRFYDFFEDARKTNVVVMKELAKLMNGEIAEFAGMARWIVTLLAIINEVPTIMTHHEPKHQVRAGLTRRLPAFDYHTVTLRVPKTKPVAYINRKLSNIERKHRAHEVRGHWRVYVNDRACPREEHVWETDWENGYRLCGKCESFGRFIREHVRGDRNLGWVSKEYVVKKEHHQ